jgi:nucleoside-diphosphate-sugar epimerase
MGEADAEALDWAALDVTDGAAVTQLVADRKVKSIVHLAGLQVPFCAANPAMGARVNVEGTINILEAARAAGIKRTVFASSVAALGFPVGGPNKETLYGAYKVANEHTAYVYWKDWQVPSVCLRPNVVYGVARDQGMTSKSTAAIQAAAFGLPYDVPFTGPYSWLYAGEAAAAFIASISQDGDGAYCFDLNGRCEAVEAGLAIIKTIDSTASGTASGSPIPFDPNLNEAPLRAHVPEYPTVSINEGIKDTFSAFKQLHSEGRLTVLPS